jgi:SAM-dependent methyltransferase
MLNVIRFNWSLYLSGSISIILLFIFATLAPQDSSLRVLLFIFAFAGLLNMLLSAFVSHYVYDRSDIYRFKWLNNLQLAQTGTMALIHAGFDETSGRLRQLFPDAAWTLCDFYNPVFNTEASIRRARKLNPAPANTIAIDHRNWKLKQHSLDVVFCMFAVHEIRKPEEHILFFQQASEALKPGGKIIIVEHLCDLPNFIAFGIGFFHFYSRAYWRNIFASNTDFQQTKEMKVTPFVHIFILQKN